jgi:hypothetical protein
MAALQQQFFEKHENMGIGVNRPGQFGTLYTKQEEKG